MHDEYIFCKDHLMRERTIARGRGNGSLIFSESKIELTLKKDELYEGYFSIDCSEGSTMEGYVYSSSVRMQTDVRFISGSNAAVPYQFNSAGMGEGDVLKGNFMIVSRVFARKHP